ncbi:MAG: TnpV protein [Christensenellaceae bacterium]|jgi:hypothetical protein|nr:TnpV protein [Christensenellaceae bacterium]
MNRKTALYCRSALYNEIAVARQEAQCREYAHTLGIADANIAVYRDCGASGAALDRPAMNALTADIKAGNVGTVIIRDTTRVARNFTLVNEWRELLRSRGLKLFTPTGKTDGEIGNGLTYSLVGDYLLPNLALSDPQGAPPLGRYGRRRRAFLEEHQTVEYSRLLLSERLFPHLRDVDAIADERRRNGVPESLIVKEIVCEH